MSGPCIETVDAVFTGLLCGLFVLLVAVLGVQLHSYLRRNRIKKLEESGAYAYIGKRKFEIKNFRLFRENLMEGMPVDAIAYCFWDREIQLIANYYGLIVPDSGDLNLPLEEFYDFLASGMHAKAIDEALSPLILGEMSERFATWREKWSGVGRENRAGRIIA